MVVIMVSIVVAVGASAAGLGLRLLWLWATRDRRYAAAQELHAARLREAERERAAVTSTAVMPAITETPVRGRDTPDVLAAHGAAPTASTTPSGGVGGNAAVATDSAPDAVRGGGFPAGEPIHRNPVIGASGSPRPLMSIPQPVLRAGGVSAARRTAPPEQPPASEARTPRSA